MAKEVILLVEDEKLIRWSLANHLKKAGYETIETDRGEDALKALEEKDVDLVLLDYRLPDMDGLKVLRNILPHFEPLPVIMMTAYSTVESAIEAMKLGAFDYLNKPFEFEELLISVKKALENTSLKRELNRYRKVQERRFGVGNMVGKNARMMEIFQLIEKIAASSATTILLQGESGTGKDLMANTIHFASDRTKKPFMSVACSAMSEENLDYELFGHEKGVFPGAATAKKGIFELADGGTAFLDEIGRIGASIQFKLLRFLEDRRFKRAGGTRDIHVDVRVIAASSADLRQAVASGVFRKDLYYRLKVIPITIPPLRERPEDIPLLVKYFIGNFDRAFKKNTRGVTNAAMRVLIEHPWPGNIRELKNLIERVMILEDKELIDRTDLPMDILVQNPYRSAEHVFVLPPGGVVLEEMERSLIEQALSRTGGNQTRSAKLLGLTRDTLRYRLKKFDL